MTLFSLKPANARLPRKRLLHLGLALTAFAFTGMAHAARAPQGKPILLAEKRGSGMEAVARKLSADQLKDAAKHHDMPLIMVASAPLSPGHKNMALFVQLQSAGMCGSAGCATSVYLRHGKKWDNVLDSVNGSLAILPTRHHGLYDLLVDKDDKWIWNGTSYQDTLAAR